MAPTEDDPVRITVAKLEAELGIESGLLEKMFDDDDWSFVIKTHAVLEAAVTHLLAGALNEPRLVPFLARLELSGTTIGKLPVVKALELLGDEERRFVRSMSELRNDLVHDIRNLGFTFKTHVERMDRATLVRFRKNFDTWTTGGTHEELFGKKVDVVEFFRSNPKLAIWYSTMVTLAMIYERRQLEFDKRQWRDERVKFAGVVEFATRINAAAKDVLPVPTLDEPPKQDGE